MTNTGKVTKGQLPKHTASIKILRKIMTSEQFNELMQRYVSYRDKGLFEKQK